MFTFSWRWMPTATNTFPIWTTPDTQPDCQWQGAGRPVSNPESLPTSPTSTKSYRTTTPSRLCLTIRETEEPHSLPATSEILPPHPSNHQPANKELCYIPNCPEERDKSKAWGKQTEEQGLSSGCHIPAGRGEPEGEESLPQQVQRAGPALPLQFHPQQTAGLGGEDAAGRDASAPCQDGTAHTAIPVLTGWRTQQPGLFHQNCASEGGWMFVKQEPKHVYYWYPGFTWRKCICYLFITGFNTRIICMNLKSIFLISYWQMLVKHHFRFSCFESWIFTQIYWQGNVTFQRLLEPLLSCLSSCFQQHKTFSSLMNASTSYCYIPFSRAWTMLTMFNTSNLLLFISLSVLVSHSVSPCRIQLSVKMINSGW